MPTYYRYMVDRKLKSSDTSEYRSRAPICQVCGKRLLRLAVREGAPRYEWLPTGWWCGDCSIIDMDMQP